MNIAKDSADTELLLKTKMRKNRQTCSVGKSFIAVFFILLLLNITNLLAFLPKSSKSDTPLVIAHRGSCGMRPEETVEAYTLAVEQGADFIECDLALTKDLVLVCSHDPGINKTTNVKELSYFKQKITSYNIDGEQLTDWFIIDFTLEELMKLRKVEYRPYRNQQYNGKFQFSTFDQYLQIAQNAGRKVGIYPEVKDPDFYNPILKARGHRTTVEDILLESLEKNGFSNRDNDRVYLQSFSSDSLMRLRQKTDFPLIWLRETPVSETDMGLAAVNFQGFGVSKDMIVEVDDDMQIRGITDLVNKIQGNGLKVHVFTLRNEGMFLPWSDGCDPQVELDRFAKLGVDGFFTDFPATAVRYLEGV